MHGYFMDIRLYHKAKSIADPFAFENYKKNLIQKKIEEARASRVKKIKVHFLLLFNSMQLFSKVSDREVCFFSYTFQNNLSLR